MKFRRLKLEILVALILTLTAFTSFALAGDPLENDQHFLWTDPDGDELLTGYELLIGSDPYNSDSDNDGLDDFWEDQNFMDPADSSDAHLDYDYFPSSNFSEGENAANFDAIQKLGDGTPMTWPSNPEILFTSPVLEEDGPHYDNYEEYYRPYTTAEGTIKIMKTDPNDPDCDDDGLLDPDDYEPFNFKNDGTGEGGVESSEIVIIEDSKSEPTVPQDLLLKDFKEEQLISNYDIDIGEINSNSEANVENKKYPIDADNDGI